MKEIHQALYAFWSRFYYEGVPIAAYLDGHVPEGAAFPYITYGVSSGRAFATSMLSATVWCRATSGMNVNAQRAAILDNIDRALPEGDTRIDLPHGFLILRRGSGDFHAYQNDDNDTGVVGGITQYEMTVYKM